MSSKPWNNWHGLTEGDMVVEMAEYAVGPESLSKGLYQGAYNKYYLMACERPEALRKLWWETIGQYSTTTEDN